MDYPIMEPPIEFDSFEKMTKKEAQLHFDWYIEELPKRLELLKMAYIETASGDEEDFDLTPHSLIRMWKWFLLRIETVPKSADEYDEEMANIPEWLHKFFIGNTEKPSIETICVAMDVAIYFSKVLISNHDHLSWTFRTKPKKVENLNRPVIIGFSNNLTLDPREILYNLTLRSLTEEKDDKALFNLYNAWSQIVYVNKTL